MTATREEQSIIQAAVDYANLPAINAPNDVNRVFRRMGLYGAGSNDWTQGLSVEGLRDDQQRVRKWLGLIASRRPSDRESLVAEVNTVLHRGQRDRKESPVRVRMHMDSRADLPAIHLSADGLEGITSIAVMLIFSRGLSRRVRSCQLPGCSRFRVTWSGRVWTYCDGQLVLPDGRRISHQQEGERLKAIKRAKAYRLAHGD